MAKEVHPGYRFCAFSMCMLPLALFALCIPQYQAQEKENNKHISRVCTVRGGHVFVSKCGTRTSVCYHVEWKAVYNETSSEEIAVTIFSDSVYSDKNVANHQFNTRQPNLDYPCYINPELPNNGKWELYNNWTKLVILFSGLFGITIIFNACIAYKEYNNWREKKADDENQSYEDKLEIIVV